MKHGHVFKTWIAAGSAAALLAACGGGGGDEAPAPAPGPLEAVPAEANASSAGLVGYLGGLGMANGQAEGVEPVALDGFAPLQPDDTEPEPVT